MKILKRILVLFVLFFSYSINAQTVDEIIDTYFENTGGIENWEKTQNEAVFGGLILIEEEIKFTDLELIFKNLKNLFQKKGYIINWKELEKQDLNQTINTLAMASPFSLEEKQILLETISLKDRKKNLEDILLTYNFDNFDNKTIQ